MNKVNPKTFTDGNFVDEDAVAMRKMADAALSIFPKGPPPVIRSRTNSNQPTTQDTQTSAPE